VAVREGNHVLGVYACDPDKPPVAIRYLVDPLVPGADIEISPSGRKYTVKKEFGKTLECRARMLYSESIIILFMFELYLRLCANSKCFIKKNKERGSGEGSSETKMERDRRVQGQAGEGAEKKAVEEREQGMTIRESIW